MLDPDEAQPRTIIAGWSTWEVSTFQHIIVEKYSVLLGEVYCGSNTPLRPYCRENTLYDTQGAVRIYCVTVFAA